MILVVEDNDFVRMQIVKFLRDGDHEVVEASNAPDALSQVEKNEDSIQLVLVDIRMEPEDGFDFLNKLKAKNIAIPAMLVTGDDNPDILAKASQAGVSGILKKPVNKDRLLKMVERAIAGSRHS